MDTKAGGPPNAPGIPVELWRRIRAAPHRLLMLDYDGTLAPLRHDRAHALPFPGMVERLRALARSGHTTIAIVSGRPVEELDRFLGLPDLAVIGEHGWDERTEHGDRIHHPLPEGAAGVLEAAERLALERGWGAHLERKRSGLVLHTRALSEPRARLIESEALEIWSAAGETGTLRLARTSGGVELRARGRDKGDAARSLISQAPPGTLPVFVGDDVTDEDAFEAVSQPGFGVRVGGGDLPSHAVARLADCEAVREFLEHWLRID